MNREKAELIASIIGFVVAFVMIGGFWAGIYYVVRALIRYHAAEIAAAAVEASK